MSAIKINRLFEQNLMPDNNVFCVYCLFGSNGVCIYVGQTKNLEKRIYDQFKSGKEFERFSFELCDKKGANDLEALTIVRMKPTLNKNLPSNSKFVSTLKLREDISDLLFKNENKLRLSFTAARFTEARKTRYKTKKYLSIDDYNHLINIVENFFD